MKHITPGLGSKASKSTKNQKDMVPTSDSDESIVAGGSDDSAASSDSQSLSLIAEFDELIRLKGQQRSDEIENKFIEFLQQTKILNDEWKKASNEVKRLQTKLEKTSSDTQDLERKLGTARKLLDEERKRIRKVEEERDDLEIKIARVVGLLFNNNESRLPDETRQQLAFLNTAEHNLNSMKPTALPQLSTIQETNTTGSLLSDFSCSMSEDGLDTSAIQCGKTWKSHRPSLEGTEEPECKKRRSSSTTKVIEINPHDKVRATTTLTVKRDGPITATSIIEAVPPKEIISSMGSPADKAFPHNLLPSAPPEHLIRDLWQRSPQTMTKSNARQHNFQSKTTVVPQNCDICEKRICFAKMSYKCKDCRVPCHPECRENVVLPCNPLVQSGMSVGTIADYAPVFPPMIPPLIIQCTNEIEAKGLNEIGLYRVPGSEKDVKTLKDKLIKGKADPHLNQVDVHVLCGTVRSFLRSLQEPLITRARWWDFVQVVETKDEADIPPALCQMIGELPQPNRETLAHMILHFIRIAASPPCKMPLKNLSRVFAPTIVGYSSEDPHPTDLINETRKQGLVMDNIINLPRDYWESLVNYNNNNTPLRGLQQTPSTDSLILGTPRGTLFPLSGSKPSYLKSGSKKKGRFFQYPST